MPIDFSAFFDALLTLLVKTLLLPLATAVVYSGSVIALTKAKQIVAGWSDDRREIVFGWVQVLAKAAEKKMANGELTNGQQAKKWVLANAQSFLDLHKIKLPLDGLEAMLEWTIAEGLHKAVVDEDIDPEVLDKLKPAMGFGGNVNGVPQIKLPLQIRDLGPGEVLGSDVPTRWGYQVRSSGENPELDYGNDLAAGAGAH